MPRPERLQLRVPAEPASIPVLRAEVRAYARGVGLDDDAVGLIALAVTEAATNAVVHGFIGLDAGSLELCAEPGDGELVVRVRDDGRGLTPRHDSPGLGLGLPTIGRCCSRLDIAEGPGGRGTEVSMVFEAPAVAGVPGAAIGRRLESVLGAVDDAIVVTAPDGRFVYANEAAARLLWLDAPGQLIGWGAAELSGRFVLAREDGRPLSMDDLPHQRVLRGEDSASVVARMIHRETGEERWLLSSARRVLDADGLLAVTTLRDLTLQKETELHQRFLVEASEVLASSLDLEETFGHVAQLAVPALADWCAIDVIDDGGTMHRVALHHVDPAKIRFAEELRRRFPPDPEASFGPYAVVRNGQPSLMPEIPDDALEEAVPDRRHLELLRGLGLRSAVQVPISARGETLGVLTLVTAESRRAMSDADVRLAMDVGRRAGVAIDVARRFADRQAGAGENP